jgi:hypothetical protein
VRWKQEPQFCGKDWLKRFFAIDTVRTGVRLQRLGRLKQRLQLLLLQKVTGLRQPFQPGAIFARHFFPGELWGKRFFQDHAQ